MSVPFTVNASASSVHAGFAEGYAGYSGAPPENVAVVSELIEGFHRDNPSLAQTGVLSAPALQYRRRQRRLQRQEKIRVRQEEKRFRRECYGHVAFEAPKALGIIGWFQVLLWLWSNRAAIQEMIRIFRELLAGNSLFRERVLS